MEGYSELAKILICGNALVEGDRTAEYLARCVNVSAATVKRYLGELRHLGCQIVSRREGSGWVYRLENRGEVCKRLGLWLQLEQERTLLDS